MRLLAALAAATLATVLAPPAATAAGDPPLSVPADALAASLRCPERFTSAPDREPVLLVHGTFTNAEENWGWNYAHVLPARGFDVCTVTLPNRSMDDIQVASEYVVHAIREIAARSGRKVDVIGHSQGGLEPRWALRWWPSLRALVDDDVMLASPNHGTAVDPGCPGPCPAAFWQMKPGSAFITALNAGDETPGEVSYTSLYSLTDELVQPAVPAPTAALDGARNILLQDVCPGRPVEHAAFAADAAVYALVLDALTHPGPADPGRAGTAACAQLFFDGVDLGASGPETLAQFFRTFPPAYHAVPAEPPLAAYAQPATPPAPAVAGAGAAPSPSAAPAGELPATGGGTRLATAGAALAVLALFSRCRRFRTPSGAAEPTNPGEQRAGQP